MTQARDRRRGLRTSRARAKRRASAFTLLGAVGTLLQLVVPMTPTLRMFVWVSIWALVIAVIWSLRTELSSRVVVATGLIASLAIASMAWTAWPETESPVYLDGLTFRPLDAAGVSEVVLTLHNDVSGIEVDIRTSQVFHFRTTNTKDRLLQTLDITPDVVDEVWDYTEKRQQETPDDYNKVLKGRWQFANRTEMPKGASSFLAAERAAIFVVGMVRYRGRGLTPGEFSFCAFVTNRTDIIYECPDRGDQKN